MSRAPYSSSELLRFKSEGARIVVGRHVPRAAGIEVVFDPANDVVRPWRLVGDRRRRFHAFQCRPVGRHGAPWTIARLKRIGVL